MNAEQLYDSVLRNLPSTEKLKLLERLAHDLAGEKTREKPRSLLELEGIWEGLLQGKDAQEYVNELRDEWDAGR